jgi:hypothetical protein
VNLSFPCTNCGASIGVACADDGGCTDQDRVSLEQPTAATDGGEGDPMGVGVPPSSAVGYSSEAERDAPGTGPTSSRWRPTVSLAPSREEPRASTNPRVPAHANRAASVVLPRQICAWCDSVIRGGDAATPASHGICASCYDRVVVSA